MMIVRLPSHLPVALLSVALLACESPPPAPSTPVAVAEGDTIRIADLEHLLSRLPDNLRSDAAGVEAAREHLQILIDRALVLAAARQQGLAEDDTVLAQVARLVDDRLKDLVTDRLVVQSIQVTEEALQAAYEEQEMGWQLWPAHILSASEEDAWEVHRLLAQGADFATLARERSLADDAPRGGELREWFDHSDAVPALREATFGLEPGQWTEPVETIDGFEIVKVLDKRRIPFAQMRARIDVLLRQARWAQRRQAVIDSLRQAFGVRIHRDLTGALLKAVQGRHPLEPGQTQAPFVEWQHGRITSGWFVDQILSSKKVPTPQDSLAVYTALERYFLADSLLVEQGRRLQLADEPSFQTWRRQRLDQAMIERYRSRLLAGRIHVTLEEAREHYARYKGPYSLPGEIHLTELLLDTEAEARAMLDSVRAGADFERLAIEHTRRPISADADQHLEASPRARLVIEPLRSSPYHGVFQDSSMRRVGVVQGPVVMENRYALFRLDKPIEPYYLPFERVARPIRARIARRKADQLFEEHMVELRARKADRITVDAKVLRRFAQTHPRAVAGAEGG